MDIMISHKVAAKYPTVRRSFYIPHQARPLYGGLEAWHGYFQSARPTMSGKMMINVDLTATAFYEKGPLIHMVAKVINKPLDTLHRGLSGFDSDKVEDFIRGLKIRINHRTSARRKYKIEGITPNPASQTMFDTDNGRIDVGTYFRNTYNKPLEYPSLPCVIVNRRVYLPMEVCEVIPVNYIFI